MSLIFNSLNYKIMKKIIMFILIIGLNTLAFAQVIIGNVIGTASDKTSVLLEFSTEKKGFVLPYVRSLPTIAKGLVQGTIVLDASSSGGSRVKVYDGNAIAGTGGWKDLNGVDGDVSSQLVSQPATSEDSASKAIIGATTSSASGVLVLESQTKAMVLPQVGDVNEIPSPAPGMMVYVNKTGAKRLAVFNGKVWSFWKP
jgi:hypothetical protein